MPNQYLGTEELISQLQQSLPFSAFVTKHAFAASCVARQASGPQQATY